MPSLDKVLARWDLTLNGFFRLLNGMEEYKQWE